MTNTLSGKTAVIIGGSGGIGAAAAQALAAEGATVVVTWRSNEAAANALLATLPGSGHLARRAVVEDALDGVGSAWPRASSRLSGGLARPAVAPQPFSAVVRLPGHRLTGVSLRHTVLAVLEQPK